MGQTPSTADRRRFLCQASLAAAGWLVAPRLLVAQGGDLVADTITGKVRGVALDGGVKLFRGIPYGGDTSGRNRFMPPNFDASEDALMRYAETQSPGRGDEIVAAYRRLYPSKRPHLLQSMMATDRGWRRSAVTQAERKAAQGTAAAFLYRWDWPVPGGGNRWGATHGADLSASLANPTTDMTMNTAEARMMATRLGSAYIAFAKTGNPDNGAMPHWPAHNATERPVMIFDTRTRVERDPNGELRLLWDRLLAQNA